ncbi:hypothetical protein OG897_35230 [Streptomyces sp. NBC_00237]|uniref:hypothetical protein n=1 Tax=Streptomyces sp. NBC_00237 TaxID=2975687 RepID=UPI0022557481|nr:hypothetical protein [Streptomyces sp. NBC_00237]MCX5206647.1 hypothetical protein [Streptomyces sp. NBC_00237]
MKIDSENNSENNRASLRRRWGVPIAVATGVAALSVTAVTVLGGSGEAQPLLADPAGNPTRATTPSPSPSTAPGSTSGGAGSTSGGAGSTSGGAGSTSGGAGSTSGGGSAPAASFSVASTKTTPIDAGTVTKILASCLGSDASRFHPVAAVRAPVSAQDRDGVVMAVDSGGKYVQCVAKGDRGKSENSPPTFINDRLWGAGHKIAYFDTTSTPAGKGKYQVVGAGHYKSGIAKITISYGNDPKQYPAVMAGGAFVHAAALSVENADPRSADPSPYVHAFDASGKEIYNQKKDPEFSDQP